MPRPKAYLGNTGGILNSEIVQCFIFFHLIFPYHLSTVNRQGIVATCGEWVGSVQAWEFVLGREFQVLASIYDDRMLPFDGMKGIDYWRGGEEGGAA